MSAATPLFFRVSRRSRLCVNFVLFAWFAVCAVPATAANVGVETRFDYVAVFPLAVSEQQIEQWRQQVLAQPRLEGCLGGRPCIARMLRLVLAGSGGREVIAFDVMSEASSEERAAIAAAVVAALPGTALHIGARPVDVDSAPLGHIH